MRMQDKAKGAKAKQAEQIDQLHANNFLCFFPEKHNAEQVNARRSAK